MEFYAAVSTELQRQTLRLWHGSVVNRPCEHNSGENVDYVAHTAGLFPQPQPITGGNAKQRDARAKKFALVGRLMAQALLDARMVSP